MIVYKFKCASQDGVLLLVPTNEVPEASKSACGGGWKYAGQLADDFKDDDIRIAVDSKKAMEDIRQQGFHLARYSITSTTTEHHTSTFRG
jgi:hypothetical protein